MSLPTQRIAPGHLEEAYRNETKRLAADDAIGKIFAKGADLWKADSTHEKIIANRLGWIGVLDAMRSQAAAIGDFAKEVVASGVRDIVLLGMGGSSLAPEVFSLTFPAPSDGRRFFVLDTTDPDALIGVTSALDLKRTIFVVASKSGKTVETLSQFFHFHERLRQAGIAPAGQHFIAITDADSHLDQLSREYSFRRTFRNPVDIGGRYSALSYFGLVPAALWGVDVAKVLDAAIEMRTACSPQAAPNGALQLGALLGAAAKAGRDKLVLLGTPKLVPLGNWIEQLIAESTGKEHKGIVPVAGGAMPPLDVLVRDCVTVVMSLRGEDDPALRDAASALEKRGAPVVEIRMTDASELGGEFFHWEMATAVAGASLGIDPFDEPNVQESKDNTARILEAFEVSRQMPLGTPRMAESGIEVFAAGSVRSAVSGASLAGALGTLFAARRPNDYLAVLAYVERDAANGADLGALRAMLAERLSLPVLLGYGPRYMHSIGQLYKGGPTTGMFLVITSQEKQDLAIPGAKYTFGELEMAQALGDLQSLDQRDKPALRLHLTHGAPAGLAVLRRAAQSAPVAPQPAKL